MRARSETIVKRRRESGFTLIEISIVLVIIGLIVGGVLVGQDLIAAAQIRRQVGNLQQYTVAINVFSEKYGYLPGDLPLTARARFGMPPPDFPLQNPIGFGNSANNPGNGSIDTFSTYYGAGVLAVPEPEYVFIDLSWATLIPGSYYSIWGWGPTWIGTVWPKLTFNEAAGVMAFTYQGSTCYFMGMTSDTGPTGFLIDNLSLHGVMTPSQAYAIDSKIDDGVPSTGTVMAITVPYYLPATDTTAGQCVVDGTAHAYNMNSNGQWCRLLVQSQ